MPRPYIKLDINALTDLANDISKEPKVRKDIVKELKHRSTGKAKALLKKLTDRPYIGFKIIEIDALVKDNPSEEIRAAILNELLFRKTAQAKALLKELSK